MVLNVEAADVGSTGSGTSMSGAFGMTASAGDVVWVWVCTSAAATTVTSITGTHCIFQPSARATWTNSVTHMEEWWGVTTSPLSGVSIVVNLSNAGAANAEFVCIAVTGGNTVSPFDSNVGLPAETQGAPYHSNKVTYSTSNPNDLIIVVLGSNTGYGSTLTVAAGFTAMIATQTAGRTGVSQGGGSANGEYEVVSSPQSSVSTGFTFNPGSGTWILAADALVAAGGAAASLTQGASIIFPARRRRKM